MNSYPKADDQTCGLHHPDRFLIPGTVISERYRIQATVGHGGFAAVYAAEDLLLGEVVALKLFSPEISLETGQLHRIKREIRLSRKISDPRVVKIFSMDKWNERWYLVMELLEGETLRQRLDRVGPLGWNDFKPFFLEILAGVSVLHAHQIVHRDIKPSNIMLTVEGGVKILDFGLAKELGDMERSFTVGEVVGTPRYLSPEHARGEVVDSRSDVFQLGLLLKTALSGMPPLEGFDTLAILAKRMARSPEAIEKTDAPHYVREGLRRALRKRSGWRFSDARAMARYFSTSNHELVVIGKQLSKWGAVVILITAMAAVGWRILFPRKSDPVRLRSDAGRLELIDAGDHVLWSKDFSPRKVHRAELQHCHPPLQRYRSNLDVHHLVYAFLSSLPGLNQRNQPTLGATWGDGRLLQIIPDGGILANHSLSGLIQSGDYGFISRAYVTRYETRDLDGDGVAEIIANIVQARGMFPCALLLIANGRLMRVVSPGVIDGWTISPGPDNEWKFSLRGRANRMGHLNFFVRLRMSTKATPGGVVRLIPHLDDRNPRTSMGISQLVYAPSEFYSLGNQSLPSGGPIELISPSGARLEIRDNGKLRLMEGNTERVFHDPPNRLAAVYEEIHFALQSRDLHYNLDNAALRLEKAAGAGVETPWLKALIDYFRGDVEIRRGRFERGREFLRSALGLHPGFNDAAHRLLEAVLIQDGPIEALNLLDGEFSGFKGFWGLSSGRDFFRALCLLQAGDFESAMLFSNSLERAAVQNATLLRLLVDLMQGENISGRIPTDNVEMSLLYTWEEYRLLEGRARVLAGDESGRGEFCFQDVKANSRLRRHLTPMSLAWYALKGGRGIDAGRMARKAFADLKVRSRGDLETYFWWFYDAWVYGRIMEDLGETREARRGFSACVAANPHTDLAKRAKLRLARPFRGGPDQR